MLSLSERMARTLRDQGCIRKKSMNPRSEEMPLAHAEVGITMKNLGEVKKLKRNLNERIFDLYTINRLAICQIFR